MELLPGWDAIEDLIGAALVTRQPVEEAARFRSSVNVMEVPATLPESLHAFADGQAAALVELGGNVVDLYGLPADSRSRQPGVLAAGIVVRHHSPDLVVVVEQLWADADEGCLVFTVTAEEAFYSRHRETLLSVPRSLELRSQWESD